MAIMKGYVTTLDSILGKTDYEMEQALGFSQGALKSGYKVYALTEPVSASEFYWRDKTRYSGGWRADPSVKFGSDPNVVWGVQRQDELRAALGKKLNYDEKAVDAVMDGVLRESLTDLNQRTGPRRIVKVVPNKSPDGYPDARSGNIPQWELVVKKQFTLMSDYH
jgi:hypothetical protein